MPDQFIRHPMTVSRSASGPWDIGPRAIGRAPGTNAQTSLMIELILGSQPS